MADVVEHGDRGVGQIVFQFLGDFYIEDGVLAAPDYERGHAQRVQHHMEGAGRQVGLGVEQAVESGLITRARYLSYLRIMTGQELAAE